MKNKSNGELIVGRYFGVFGFDALVLDMTGAGVGATDSAAPPLNTQLGGAGYGYVFPDRLSQMTYIHSFGDTEAAIGIFQPLDTLSFGGSGFSGDIGVNLQLNLNQFRVDFALNIDPAKNWPSTDSSDQETNFMGHLFKAIVGQ